MKKGSLREIIPIREACTTINKLFNQPLFFERLCDCSKNDIDEVIENISLIINYYLSTKDIIYTYPIQELLRLASETLVSKEYIIHPTHSSYENIHRFRGINTRSILEDSHAMDLYTLEHAVSFKITSEFEYDTIIYQSFKEAINHAFECPIPLYRGILKQPLNKELPMVVGTDEKSYYRSILDIRLKNVEELYKETNTKKAKRVINRYIGKSPLLIIFPKKTTSYTISEESILSGHIEDCIAPKYLSYIKIPTKYKLLSICAKNKGIRVGELLDIKDGKEYKVEQQEEQREYHTYYSRYELIPVTDIFEYDNDELSGDISYDIDLIYGILNTNRIHFDSNSNPLSNISTIKEVDDIHVRLTNGKYNIINGRHRILYLKNFYVTYYEKYKKSNKLEELKKLVTIPMSIERTIESKVANDLISKLKELTRIDILKTNINNDNIELLIIINNNVYIIKNEIELNELYELIKSNNYNNRFLVGINTSNQINYDDLFDYLIITLKEKIYTMDLIDIIEYLTTHGFYQNDKYYLTSDFNYYYLYFKYCDKERSISHSKVHNRPINIVETTELKFKQKEIGTKIMTLISEHPDLLLLKWPEFYNIIKTIPPFDNYSEELILNSANYMGYQRERLLMLYENDKYTKSLFL